MAKGETELHKELKALSLMWAEEAGYTCRGVEIRLENCGYRADVAAYKPAYQIKHVKVEAKTLRQRQPVIGTTAVFECKQARSDLLNDSCITTKTREKLKRLYDRKNVLERLLAVHLPSAANGDSLFQEFQSHSFESANHKGYQKLLKDISVLQNGLMSKTKFENLFRYRCANLCYLVTTEDLIRNYELPLGWGWLVKNGNVLELRQKPIWNDIEEGARLSILQRIAMGATARTLDRLKWERK